MDTTQKSDYDSTTSSHEDLYWDACDLTLLVSDAAKEFKAHRGVLAKASPFFEMLFYKEGVIRLGYIVHLTRWFHSYFWIGSIQ